MTRPDAGRRVAFFIPSLTGGGAERVAVNLMKMLPGVDRHLVLMDGRIAYEYDAALHVLEGDFSVGSPAERLRCLAANTIALAALKRKLGDATWLSFTTWANILNVLTGFRGRTIVSSHNHESANIGGRLGPVIRTLVRHTYARADAVVTVSHSVKNDLVRNFGVPEHRIDTIYNAIDAEEIRRLSAEPLDPPLADLMRHPTIVTAGSLTQQKGQWHLVRAFARLKRDRPDARLLILGEGSVGPYLVDLCRAYGLGTWTAWSGEDPSSLPAADVAFLGFQKNPFRVFRHASVFAFPSLWEGFGNVIVEALACGTLIVSADCKSGPREILAPSTADVQRLASPELGRAGILMPPFDGIRRDAGVPPSREEQVWSDLLLRALRDGELRARYAEPGRARASEFELSRIAPAWERLLFGGSLPGPSGHVGQGP